MGTGNPHRPFRFYEPTFTYGEDSPYGKSLPKVMEALRGLSSTGEFYLKKCQSVRISIEDVQTVVGEGLSISAINFVGNKTNLRKS